VGGWLVGGGGGGGDWCDRRWYDDGCKPFLFNRQTGKILSATFEMKNRKNGTMIQNLMKIRDAGGVVTFQDVSLVCCLLPRVTAAA